MRRRKPKKSDATKAVQGLIVFLIMFVSLYLLLDRLTAEEGTEDQETRSDP